MPSKILQEVAEVNVLNKCKEKNYILLKPYFHDNGNSRINLKCKIDGYEWNISYKNFMRNVGCPKCGGSLKLTQEVAEGKILTKCKEKNYTLLQPYIHENVDSKIYLKCDIDEYEWVSSYKNFINKDRNCHKCSGKLKLTQEETELKILTKCKEKNYTLLQPYIHENIDSRIYLKCDIDGYEWNISYDNFINLKQGCPKCGGKLKLSSEYTNMKIYNKCKEKKYTLLYPYIHENVDSKIYLKCDIDGYEWIATYDNFINQNTNCPKCAGCVLTYEDFKLNSNKVHGVFYDYSEFIYINNTTKSVIICPIHGKFKQSSNIHLRGCGCKKCGDIKRIKTNIEKFGFKNPFQSVEIKNKIRKTNELNNVWVLEENISKFRKYRNSNNTYIKKIKKQLINDWDGYDYYDDYYIKNNFSFHPTSKLYPTIDHKKSLFECFIEGISIEEASNPNNLCWTKKYLNSSKGNKIEEEFKNNIKKLGY
jgi:ribosomal protein S27AE